MSAFEQSTISGRKKKVIIEPIFPVGEAAANAQPAPARTAGASSQAASASTPPTVRQQPKAIRNSSIAGFGVSLSALSQKKEEEEVVEAQQTEILTETFTPLQLLSEWKAYAESIPEEHHLKNTMLNCLPDLLNRDTFEVVVNNPVQEQRLLDNAVNIMPILRKNLRNTQVQMKVRVTVENEKKLGFTSLEKFNLMIEQNESVKRLKDEFGLELM